MDACSVAFKMQSQRKAASVQLALSSCVAPHPKSQADGCTLTSSFLPAQIVRGVDPQPACLGDADWTASGDGGWYVVVPLADGGDATPLDAASVYGAADAGGGSGATDAAMCTATIDWEQIETYERGYLVSFHVSSPALTVCCNHCHLPRADSCADARVLVVVVTPRQFQLGYYAVAWRIYHAQLRQLGCEAASCPPLQQ